MNEFGARLLAEVIERPVTLSLGRRVIVTGWLPAEHVPLPPGATLLRGEINYPGTRMSIVALISVDEAAALMEIKSADPEAPLPDDEIRSLVAWFRELLVRPATLAAETAGYGDRHLISCRAVHADRDLSFLRWQAQSRGDRSLMLVFQCVETKTTLGVTVILPAAIDRAISGLEKNPDAAKKIMARYLEIAGTPPPEYPKASRLVLPGRLMEGLMRIFCGPGFEVALTDHLKGKVRILPLEAVSASCVDLAGEVGEKGLCEAGRLVARAQPGASIRVFASSRDSWPESAFPGEILARSIADDLKRLLGTRLQDWEFPYSL